MTDPKPLSAEERVPLKNRPDLQTSRFLSRELGELARKHKLIGCVLVNSCGEGGFATYTSALADQILTAIDDGKFDPQEPTC